MSFFIKENGKIIIPRSFYIKILVFLILVGFSSLALKPLHNALNRAITNIRANFIEKLETFTGMEIRYSSIRPAFFNSFDIRNLRFTKDETEILVISRARFYFSLSELLSVKKLVIHTIQIDRPVLRMDLEKDKNIIEILSSLSSSGDSETFKQIMEFLPDKADYRIRNFNVFICSGQTMVQLENMNINFKAAANNINFETIFGAEIKLSGFLDRTIIINGGIGINGEYLLQTGEIKASIVLSSFACSEKNPQKRQESFFRLASVGSGGINPLFNINSVNVDFSYWNKIACLKASGENPPLDYFIRYDAETRGILSEINFNNFLPGSLISFSNYWKNISYFLNMAISGNVSLQYENNGQLDYRVNLYSGNLARTWQENLFLSDAFLINITGDRKYIAVKDFCLNTSADTAKNGFFQGIINFKGGIGITPLRPSGTLYVEHASFTGKESINGIFDIKSRGKDIEISSDNFSIGSFSMKKFNTYLNSSDRDISVAVSGICEDKGAIYLDAVMNKNPGRVEASLTLDSFSIYNLAEIFRPFTGFINIPSTNLNPLRSTLIDTEIFFSSDFNNVAYNVPIITVTRGKTVIGEVSMSGTNQNFTLSNGVFYLGKNELTVSANAVFPSVKVLDFSVNANYLDVSWNISGHILDRNTLIISDPNGLHVYGSLSNTGAISGYIEGVNFPVPAAASPVYMNFYSALRFYSMDFWSLDVSHFGFQGLYTQNGAVNFNISGIADQDGAILRNILYNDNKGSLAGSADFTWDHNFSHIQYFVNVMDGHENGELYKLEGMLKNNHVGMNGSVSNMRIDRFIQGNGVMLASADAQLSWNSADSFDAHVYLKSFSARQSNNIQASGEMFLTENELMLHDFKLDYGNLKTVFPVFNISPAEGIALINADISGFNNKKTIEGMIDINAGFNKIDSWINMGEIINSFNGTLQINNIKYGELYQDNITFLITGNESAFSVSGGIQDMLRLEMDNAGNFYLSLSSPFPVRGSFAGIFNRGYFDAYTNDFYIDMASLWDLARDADDNFNIAGGYITGKMNLRGPVWNPEFYGTGTGTSFNIQVPEYISDDIKPVPFHITAEGYEMTFDPVVTTIGGGSGNVSGWFRFEYWTPKNVGLNINIPRRTPVPYNVNIAGFIANGDASGKLELVSDSNDRILEVKGNLYMDNTEMGVIIEDITAVKNGSEDTSEKNYNVFVDISITTGPMVEFFWPNTIRPLLRVNPEMGTVFLVKSDSQSGQYSLVSDIKVRRGELNYLDRNFYIRQGSLVFRESETQFNPRLSARAEIRERSNTGPVTIAMIIENQPLLDFTPRFESTPSLTQLEINSILGHNISNTQGSENIDQTQRVLLTSSTDLMAQFVLGSDVLSQMIFMRQFERTLRNFLNLDMLSIRTKFLQNAVISGTSGFGMLPSDKAYRFGNYFDNTTVFIGKYIGQDMFVQGTLTMRYDESRKSLGGLKFEPDIGIELQSPFFSIRWAFFPNHPENLWVNDNSITLLWSKSF